MQGTVLFPDLHLLKPTGSIALAAQDLVIPTFKIPSALFGSPLIGGSAQPRDTLFFFRGDFRPEHEEGYSRGIRQGLRSLSQKRSWKEKYKILIGNRTEVPGEYNELLRTSKFCLVVPGASRSKSLLRVLLVLLLSIIL